jgi:hypothetical protein
MKINKPLVKSALLVWQLRQEIKDEERYIRENRLEIEEEPKILASEITEIQRAKAREINEARKASRKNLVATQRELQVATNSRAKLLRKLKAVESQLAKK